jgi:hypothetical protein
MIYNLFTAKIRRIGTSFGIIIPKKVIKEQKLREGDGVQVSILKKKNIDDVFMGFGVARGAKSFKRDRTDRY